MFYHGSIWHAIGCTACVLAIARSQFRVPASFVAAAFAIAVCAPMGTGLTVGGSGVCYALLGAMAWQSAERKRFHATIALFMVLGYTLASNFNTPLHLHCYVAGVLYGSLWKE